MYIVADIGGTKMRIAASRDLELFDEPVIQDTPQSYEAGLALITETAKRAAGGEPIEAIAAGFPGVLSRDHRSLHDAPNIKLWNDTHLADDLEAALSAKAHLMNDTALVGLGEAVYGAGAGASIVMYMTVSTGVNAARYVDGVPDKTAYGSETGDQYLFIDETPVQLGDIISGAAVVKKYGMPPRDLGKDSPVWEEFARITAFGVYNSIVHWSPDRVVLGGSMFNEIGIPVNRVADHLREINTKYPEIPDIVHSGLGDVGGLYGGLALLKQKR